MSGTPFSRRRFIAGGLGSLAAFSGVTRLNSSEVPVVPSVIHGATHRVGHLLRSVTPLPPPSTRRSTRVAIVGGGIAGLSAGWWLSRNGFHDYIVLELEDALGGTALSGENSITPFPWGAHYVPTPGKDARYVRTFFEEIGAITGYDDSGEPTYDELMLCGAPEARLFIHGRWQEGLLPATGLAHRDSAEQARFFALLDRFRSAIGSDGRPAFTIPAHLSSRDPEYRRFDSITFAELMRQWGLSSPYLNWYIDYCFRDDFGALSTRISAWAGLHYFCARSATGSNGRELLLTWPEGNGFLVKELRRRISGEILTQTLVTGIIPTKNGVAVEFLDLKRSSRGALDVEAVVYAAPRFTAPFVIDGINRSAAPPAGLRYSPWIVANISLKPIGGAPTPRFAWDNVYFHGQTIGYVVATHQSLDRGTGATVLTMYWPLTETEPEIARAHALTRSADEWSHLFLSELLRYEPELHSRIERVDLWVWGHGMAIPTPGLFERWEHDRSPDPRIIFANADRTGFGLFEEAQYWGVEAARTVLHGGTQT